MTGQPLWAREETPGGGSPTPTLPLPNVTCPLCDADNGCAPARSGTFETPCWCRDARIDPAALARVPAASRGTVCLCRQCAGGAPAEHEAGAG